VTVREAWVAGVAALKRAPVVTESPELDARVLLCHLLGTDLAGLFVRYPAPFDPSYEERWQSLLRRRGEGVPVAWLVGYQEFMGLEFAVGEGVLVPRADTETLVDAALALWPALPGQGGVAVADVCAGSGCVGLAVARLAPAGRPIKLTSIELSPQALFWTRENAARLLPAGSPGEVVVCQGDLLQGTTGPFDLIVSNPPYLTPEETLERKERLGWQEPALALDGGGKAGLDLPVRLIEQAACRLSPTGWLLMEAADAQMPTLAWQFGAAGLADVRFWCDLSGQRRVVGGRKP